MRQIALLIFLVFIAGCSKENNTSHASGVFESEDVIVSALAAGEITKFDVEEGLELQKDTVVGNIDNKQLQLKKLQLQNAIYSAALYQEWQSVFSVLQCMRLLHHQAVSG